MTNDNADRTSMAPFRAVSYPLRLYAGFDVLDHLATEVERLRAQRVFVVCGQTIAHRTNLLRRITRQLGDRYAGAFDRMDKDSSYPAVVAAVESARTADADLLVAAGGGSVIVGARAVAIFLAESGDPYDLMTQYPEGKPAVSPRLMAPKLPIINVPTTPTTAMNRAGTGLKNDTLDHRMEFFDPKTRPVALFWDAEALLTAPLSLARSTGTTTFTAALHAAAGETANPLVSGDYHQAYSLAARALPRLIADPEDPTPRLELCASAFLLNRAADDGDSGGRDPIAAAAYALATALHNRYVQVGQGEATAAVTPGVVRAMGGAGSERIAKLLESIGEAKSPASRPAGDALANFYRAIGMPSRLRDLEISEEDLPPVASETLKNFNANRGKRSPDYVAQMEALLRACW